MHRRTVLQAVPAVALASLALPAAPARAMPAKPIVRIVACGRAIPELPEGRATAETFLRLAPALADVAHIELEHFPVDESPPRTMGNLLDIAGAMARLSAARPAADALLVVDPSGYVERNSWVFPYMIQLDVRPYCTKLRVGGRRGRQKRVERLVEDMGHAIEATRVLRSAGSPGMSGSRVRPQRPLLGIPSLDELPRVDVVPYPAYPAAIRAAVEAGARGIVLPDWWVDADQAAALRDAAEAGVVAAGAGIFDRYLDFPRRSHPLRVLDPQIGSRRLSQEQVQTLLMLALARDPDPSFVERVFAWP